MKMKKLTAGLCALAVTMGVAVAPAESIVPAVKSAIVASAEDYEVYGDLHYQTDGKQVFIVGYNLEAVNIIVPSKIKGLPVTKIEWQAFDGIVAGKLRTVTIEPGVKEIADSAFRWQTHLNTVKLPSTLTTLGDNAFSNCSSLETINIPSSVSKMGGYCFDQCKSLESIALPDKLTVIEHRTFSGCDKLSSVSFPNELKEIEYGAFENCKSLEQVTLPNKLKNIDTVAFDECINLDRVNIPRSVTDIGYKAFGFYDLGKKNESLIIGCYKGTAAETYADENGFKKIYLNKSISSATVKTTGSVFAYNGSDIKPDVTVTLNGKKLIKGVDYTVSYSNNKNCGKATVTVSGINEYMGTAKTTFIIKPKKMTAKKLVSPKKKTVKLTWVKADGNVDGYQILLAANKKFTAGKKSVIIKRPAAAAKTIKKLKSKKTYYAKVRAFKKVDGKNYFGAWSKIKKVKVK